MRALRAVFSLLGVLLLAACGGGSLAGAPPVDGNGVRGLDGSTVAFEKGTLWAAYWYPGSILYAFPTNGSGALAPLATIHGPFNDGRGTPYQTYKDVAVAPDGTVYVLLSRFSYSAPTWRLEVYSPRSLELEHTINSTGLATQLALGGDGILVSMITPNATDPGKNKPVIKTYPYGASDPPPIRKFHLPRGEYNFSVTNDDRIYLERVDGFDVYPITATDGCCPVERITLARPQPEGYATSFAVGPDDTIYQTEVYPLSPVAPAMAQMYVNVYAPHSGTLARRIGPLPAYEGANGSPPAITVDRNNRVYVATAGSIYRFGTRANGASTPQRIITTPDVGSQVALAIGP